MSVWHSLLHFTGSDNVSGKWYGFWSGFAGDLMIFTAGWAFLRRHNCHTRGCLRIGRHPHGPYVLCSKHHPLVPDQGPTVEHIKETTMVKTQSGQAVQGVVITIAAILAVIALLIYIIPHLH